jgi:hypothetical protein
MGKGADRKKRNKEESYHVVEGQLAGNVKLVSAWHAIGHKVMRFHYFSIYLMSHFI